MFFRPACQMHHISMCSNMLPLRSTSSMSAFAAAATTAVTNGAALRALISNVAVGSAFSSYSSLLLSSRVSSSRRACFSSAANSRPSSSLAFLTRPSSSSASAASSTNGNGSKAEEAPPTRLSKPPPPEETPLTETVRDFLSPSEFYALLKEKGMDFYAGVPDSLLKDFCAYVSDTAPREKHIITANEGAAVALATGYHLATRKFPIVYMQNSGFGNAINPLVSLADPKVYSIPMLLLIGWRGEPGKKDEPQHLVQGKIMSSLLADMNIQFEVLPDFIEGAREAVESAVHYMERRGAPYAFLVRRQAFTPYKMKKVEPDAHQLTREQALRIIIAQTGQWDILVTTTGFTSREVYELRDEAGQDHKREFLTVGSMGHASAISMGVAMAKPSRQVLCLDGDGAMLMHMGTLGTIGTAAQLPNYKHVLINNGSHDSVGGQPTRGFDVGFTSIARACGYKWTATASTAEEIAAKTKELLKADGPAMLEVLTNKGARKNLGRPKQSPVQNKIEFMNFLDG